MNFKRLFGILFLFLFSVSSVNSVITPGDFYSYWSMDDTNITGTIMEDLSLNNRDLEIVGGLTTGVDGILNQAIDNPTGDTSKYLLNASVSNYADTAFSINFWYNLTDISSTKTLYEGMDSGTGKVRIRTQPSGLQYVLAGSGSCSVTLTGSINLSEWIMGTMVYDSTRLLLYTNGILGSNTSCTESATIDENRIGLQDGGANALEGRLDEFSIYNEAFSTADVLELYNNGLAFNPFTFAGELEFSNITVNNETLISPIFLNTNVLNFNTTVINISTNGLVNQTFFLYDIGDNLIDSSQFATQQLNGSFTLNLTEGNYSISFLAVNDEVNVSTANSTLVIDLSPPIINLNLSAEVNSYLINWSDVLNVSDNVSLVSCFLDFSVGSSTNCTNEAYTFAENGNITFNITAEDQSGNTVILANNTVLVNPPQCNNFFFSGSPVNNYDFGGTLFGSNPACFNVYNAGLVFGSNTLLFEKLGFSSLNVTFDINLTSDINDSFNVTQSKIILSIFDRETNALITGLSTITLVAGVGFNSTTTTGELNISNFNFVQGAYKITVENADYFTESVFFNYNNQEDLIVDVFMLDLNSSDAGFAIIEVTTDLSQFVDGAIVKALEWIPSTSSFETRAQAVTTTTGQAILNIEIGTKTYKFSAQKNDSFKTINEPNGNIVQVDGSTIPIQFDVVGEAEGSIVDGLFTNVVLTNVSQNVSIVSFAFADSNNLVSEACIKFKKVTGNIRVLLNESCVSTSSGEIIEQFLINNSFNLEVEATVFIEGQLRSIDTFFFKSVEDISFSLEKYGFDVLVPLIMMLIGLGLGFVMEKVYIAILTMNILLWMSIIIVPSVISVGTTLFLSILGSLILWGGFKK